MSLATGTKVLIRGRYEDFTDHLEGEEGTVLDGVVDVNGFITIVDAEGYKWYVQAIDVTPIED